MHLPAGELDRWFAEESFVHLVGQALTDTGITLTSSLTIITLIFLLALVSHLASEMEGGLSAHNLIVDVCQTFVVPDVLIQVEAFHVGGVIQVETLHARELTKVEAMHVRASRLIKGVKVRLDQLAATT